MDHLGVRQPGDGCVVFAGDGERLAEMPVHDTVAGFDAVLGDVGLRECGCGEFTPRSSGDGSPSSGHVLIELVWGERQESRESSFVDPASVKFGSRNGNRGLGPRWRACR